jgi:hypothetical protein
MYRNINDKVAKISCGQVCCFIGQKVAIKTGYFTANSRIFNSIIKKVLVKTGQRGSTFFTHTPLCKIVIQLGAIVYNPESNGGK